jgi:hypothetical protein
LNQSEVAVQLVNEVAGRIARFHSTPSSIFLTEEEMLNLMAFYPTNIILSALTNTAKVVQHNPTLERRRVLSAVQSIAERILNDAHSRGKNLNFKGDAQVTPKPTARFSAPKPTVDIDGLRQSFQDNCTTDASWTLSAEDVSALLQQAEAKTLYAAFKELGRYDNDHASQEKCFAKLNEVLDELAWQKEMV